MWDDGEEKRRNARVSVPAPRERICRGLDVSVEERNELTRRSIPAVRV